MWECRTKGISAVEESTGRAKGTHLEQRNAVRQELCILLDKLAGFLGRQQLALELPSAGGPILGQGRARSEERVRSE